MSFKQLKKKYSDLIKEADLAEGRKDVVSCLRKAEKIRSKIIKKIRNDCPKCNGFGYKRISIDGARTCLNCYGKGFIIIEKQIH